VAEISEIADERLLAVDASVAQAIGMFWLGHRMQKAEGFAKTIPLPTWLSESNKSSRVRHSSLESTVSGCRLRRRPRSRLGHPALK